MPTSSHTTKTKITVTLSPEVAHQLDSLLKDSEIRSRSQMVEEALRRWLADQVQQEIETKTEEYYRSLSANEQEEDKEWTTIAAEAAKPLWEK